jgi:hypothetical protein
MLRIIRRSLPVSVLIALSTVAAAAADNVQIGVRATGNGAAVQLTPNGRFTGCNGPRCFYEFARGTTVNVTATPTATGSRFARWTEGCTNAAPTCTLLLDANKLLTARFSPVTLYADRVTDGTVSLSPFGRTGCGSLCWLYDYGAVVTISAQPANDYEFRGWSGSCRGQRSSVCKLTAYEPIEALPIFECTAEACSISEPIERVVRTTITVNGRGSVQVNGKTCSATTGPSTCRYDFRRGSALVLLANSSSSPFRGWRGACRSRAPRCQFAAFRDAYGKPPGVIADFR